MSKLISLHGLKFNPFRPDVPIEALYTTSALDAFIRRVEVGIADGGYVMITGDPGTGAPFVLRFVATGPGPIGIWLHFELQHEVPPPYQGTLQYRIVVALEATVADRAAFREEVQIIWNHSYNTRGVGYRRTDERFRGAAARISEYEIDSKRTARSNRATSLLRTLSGAPTSSEIVVRGTVCPDVPGTLALRLEALAARAE